jgi:hypothetical protein
MQRSVGVVTGRSIGRATQELHLVATQLNQSVAKIVLETPNRSVVPVRGSIYSTDPSKITDEVCGAQMDECG